MSEHEVAPCALGNPHGQTMPWADATTQLCDGDDGGGVDNDDDQWHECICSEPATTRNQPTDAVSGRTVETATVGMAMRTTATTSSDDAATYSDRSTAGYDWGGGDGATVTDDDVGRGGRGANWRVGQLASLLEEVTMLEAEMDGKLLSRTNARTHAR